MKYGARADGHCEQMSHLQRLGAGLLDQNTEAFAGRSTVVASLDARRHARNQDDGLVGQLIEEGRSLHVFDRSEHKLMVSDCHQSQDRHQSV